MNKLVCGVVVDEELYMKYQDKKYRIGKEEYALRTIEIVAASKDYDAYPYLKAHRKKKSNKLPVQSPEPDCKRSVQRIDGSNNSLKSKKYSGYS